MIAAASGRDGAVEGVAPGEAADRSGRRWRRASLAFALGLAAALTAAPTLVASDVAVSGRHSSPAASEIRATAAPTVDAGFVRTQLETAIRLYDRAFRVESTGQYLDAIDLEAKRQVPGLSSISATGIGLISLAMADALGIDPLAAEKAEVTLSHLLTGSPSGRFNVRRSPTGWFEQYIDAETGASRPDYKGQHSTIDTSLLAIGAVFVGRYFEGKHPPAGSAGERVAKLARTLVSSVAWSTAVRDMEVGRLHALFIGPTEEPFPTYWGETFDEYVLIPCLGRYVERTSGHPGPLSEYWDRHVADIDLLPTKMFGAVSVLSRAKAEFVSHFTHQFAFYLCGRLGDDPKFQRALRELRDADRQWFANRAKPYPDRWWGLGAGSALVRIDKAKTTTTEQYIALTLGTQTEDDVFSPAIMAGFLALDALDAETRAGPEQRRSATLSDLRALFSRGECRYAYGDLDFLWRCAAYDPFKRVRYMQGIDFSTYMFGMAALVPEIGLGFFRRLAP